MLQLLNPTEGKMFGYNTGGNHTGLTMASMDGEGEYNGLKIGLSKRLSSGWSANANYTISKCVNQGEPATDIGWNLEVTPQAPDYKIVPNFEPATGPCANDRRHLFNLSSVLISPGMGSGFVDTITKNWQFGLIVQKRTGSPLTPLVSTMRLRVSQTRCRWPSMELTRTWTSLPGFRMPMAPRLQWINMAAFANAPTGQRGNVRRGYIYGPGFFNTDLGISRNLDLSPGKRIEVRMEMFNVFNTVNWGNPNVTVGSATAGQITTTASGPRIMQLAVKYAF